ncbi:MULTISPECIES: monovalent cation/H+ antiporter complex subunit F [Thermococcus]|uniref:Membrane bound complex 2, subunit G (Mbc2G) n=1 Tax=Thermococcus nautili TaxID=195522 RepID=W8PJN5_9EURY|nr:MULTISPECIES: monovalent cation/H+ antiporter complex subunit F [Thermococcus]AHL22294.1 membrane bound complex 2, subunit G (Mbc2G) [Thermococcus nautili]NJE48501.1 pH regulation protein F [Thermococcus sp. 9N3]CAI1493661.1 Membrane bound complex 2, subunit G (Mbc2G) [Thermococcus nautili]
MNVESVFLNVLYFAAVIYTLAFVLYGIRAIKGPTTADIILAVDCLSFDMAAFMVILGIYFKSIMLASGAIILALWAFMLDIYYTKYVLYGEVEV